jgi:hypothetical protein
MIISVNRIECCIEVMITIKEEIIGIQMTKKFDIYIHEQELG